MRRSRTPLLLLVLALALACGPDTASAKRTVPSGFFGVAFDGKSAEAPDAIQNDQLALMALSGVESVRLLFPWSVMQPEKGQKPDFERTDRTVAAAAAHGIEILPTTLYTPVWARRYKSKEFSPPARTSDYTDFIRASVRRYGPRGSFWREHPSLPRRPIRGWQIWNEPNITQYWAAPKKSSYGWPRGYGRLLRDSNTVIKREDRGARTVFAGLTGIAWLDMRRAYKSGGVRNHFDVAALQVYPQTEQRELEATRRLRAELVRARDSDVRMFVTEVAFPASKGKVDAIGQQRQETPKGMARRLSSMYALLARNRAKLKLDRVYWYTWASRYGNSISNFDFSGLVRSPDGIRHSAEPALSAYARTARRYEGCTKAASGRCR